LEARYNEIRMKCNSKKWCPMEVPALLMLGHYKNGQYYLFDPIKELR
jgi:hypothetical protein